MLYPKNNSKELSDILFKNPTSEYRGAPFWAWNCKLKKEQLLRQIEQMKTMGMGGAHIHCRTGLSTEYLGHEFMQLVKDCNEKFKEEDMLCWLYDEDRWPSGAAGGIVTKEKKYRARFLVFSPNKYKEDENKAEESYISSGGAQRSSNRKLIGCYEVLLKDGYLKYYKRLEENQRPEKGGKIWWAYLEISGSNPWFNNQAYVNTLDKKAIDRFIQVTHEAYYKNIGGDFGKSIPAIFTDEPQFTHKESLGYSEEEKDVVLPFTGDFDESYKKAYGDSIVEYLPELFWELGEGKVSLARYRYHDHISERFTTAFSDNIGKWCENHDIMLTGHMMEEPSLESQTSALGEAMRSYRSFQLPGIDMLCDYREYTTAKQAQSASNQYGRPGVISELYGVTNWDFDFRGHKLSGDWQAALGVTTRVHHLNWVSMEGEAKRDYPAAIGYQSPWYKEYKMIEEHFGRLNTALTRGKNNIKVAIIHPVESYWLHFGPKEQTYLIRKELEENFQNVTQWLLFNLIDFHYISESLFKDQANVEQKRPLKVGEMEYDVIIVPGCETLRTTTLERLEAFVAGGGKVIFMGEPAKLVDAVISNRVIELAKKCDEIPFTKGRMLKALEPYREIDIRNEIGERSDNLFYQLRIDGDKRWLFISHVNKMSNPDIPKVEKITIRVKGNWIPTLYETMTGEIKTVSAKKHNYETWIEVEFYGHDSLLYSLEKGIPMQLNKDYDKIEAKDIILKQPLDITLSEPNAMVLDIGGYRFDEGEWSTKEELLRIDNIFRKKLSYPLRMEALAQPWINPEEETFKHVLSLRFKIYSEIEVKESYLALENLKNTTIIVNGNQITPEIKGWYVDENIKKVILPIILVGENEIILKIKYNSKTNVEWCYLLGDFGVRVEGGHSKIIAPIRTLYFGDWTNQGLPFYAGNVTYSDTFYSSKGDLKVQIPQFRNPLLAVSVDGEKVGNIALAPYSVNTILDKSDEHKIDITAFGNRVNTFGTLHNCDNTTVWFGPNAWRTEGTSWSYEYQLRPTGVLVAPKITI